jgi:hypothetical protein
MIYVSNNAACDMFGLILKNVCKSKLFVAVLEQLFILMFAKPFTALTCPILQCNSVDIKNTKNRLQFSGDGRDVLLMVNKSFIHI